MPNELVYPSGKLCATTRKINEIKSLLECNFHKNGPKVKMFVNELNTKKSGFLNAVKPKRLCLIFLRIKLTSSTYGTVIWYSTL